MTIQEKAELIIKDIKKEEGTNTSIGAALSIIDGTGPLSTDGTWGNHMQFTASAISELGNIIRSSIKLIPRWILGFY